MQTWKHDASEKEYPLDGPWADEPDKGQWVDEKTDLDCLIVRNHMGTLCGYVGVAEGHPAFAQGYDLLPDLVVHGGVTFTGLCREDAEEGHGICHIPEEGRPDKVWWVGFDCGHAWDVIPIMQKYSLTLDRDSEYRDWDYVKSECELLAQQLKAMA